MTKSRLSIAAALGFLAAGLVAIVPASAGSLNVVKPAVKVGQSADLHLVDQGSWHKKKHFKKHYRGDQLRGHGDRYYRGHKKKKFKRAYRNGYDDGYYDGSRDGGYYKRGYSRYDDHNPRYRRHHHNRGHRYGSGYIRTPGFYFRF